MELAKNIKKRIFKQKFFCATKYFIKYLCILPIPINIEEQLIFGTNLGLTGCKK